MRSKDAQFLLHGRLMSKLVWGATEVVKVLILIDAIIDILNKHEKGGEQGSD